MFCIFTRIFMTSVVRTIRVLSFVAIRMLCCMLLFSHNAPMFKKVRTHTMHTLAISLQPNNTQHIYQCVAGLYISVCTIKVTTKLASVCLPGSRILVDFPLSMMLKQQQQYHQHHHHRHHLQQHCMVLKPLQHRIPNVCIMHCPADGPKPASTTLSILR